MTNPEIKNVLEYLKDAYKIYQEWTLGSTPITTVDKIMLIEIAKMIQKESIRLER